MKAFRSSWFPFLLGLITLVVILNKFLFRHGSKEPVLTDTDGKWHAPDINLVPQTPEGDMVRYGRELIVNTSKYFGPKGIIAPITNGMNCQNCHVEAGTKAFGNSFAAVASTYPKYRERSGRIESIEFRINDCMQRSLNGKAIDSLSKEMRAMISFFKWIGKEVPKGTKPAGSGIVEIPYMQKAADPQNGKTIFENKCQRCHGINGNGVIDVDGVGYKYPPLWGENSYNNSAGLYRISSLASFIKFNMPFDQTQVSPQLSDEEAWDLSAFISSQPRPEKRFAEDWPRIESKPPDFPFGPYADNFSEKQHKYGPFIPIKEAKEKKKNMVK
ncbi:MAG: c-type cytochrome [Chitinophagales bacterium]